METSPGVRSVMVEYDPAVLPLGALLTLLQKTDQALPEAVTQLPSRVVKLPIAFGDRWTKSAIERSACTPPGLLLAIKGLLAHCLRSACDQQEVLSHEQALISLRYGFSRLHFMHEMRMCTQPTAQPAAAQPPRFPWAP